MLLYNDRGLIFLLMSPQIKEEFLLLIMSLYSGLILILCYDAIRIWRRIVQASVFRMIIEDTVYWAVAAIYIFNMYLKYNYGRPRFFSLLFMAGIMILYEQLIGRKIVDKVSIVLKTIIKSVAKPLKKAGKAIKLKAQGCLKPVEKRVRKWRSKDQEDHNRIELKQKSRRLQKD